MAKTGRQSANTSNVLSVIMGGGQGTRLFPLTKERAKPAVYFGGPYRIIDFALSNCINSGLRRIFIARVGVPPRAYQQRFSTTRHASSPTGVA